MPETSHYKTLFTAIDEGYCLCEMIYDADGTPVDYRFLEVNPLFEEMTGLHRALGRTALELVPGLERSWIDTYARAAAGETMRFQSGSAAMGRHFDVFATPVAPKGRFALVFRDITAQGRAEAEAEAARAHAESLLQELNHRVMNSLAMITSIVRLEGQKLAADGAAAEVVIRLQSRLAAVTSLYRALSRAAAVTEVPAQDYLGEIAASVAEAMADPARVRLDCRIAPVTLATRQAAPLGLLVNELMTNALKHAFPPGRSGTLRVSLGPTGAGLRLAVADDGVGVDEAAEGAGMAGGSDGGTAANGGGRGRSGGLGVMLTAALAEQIGGTLTRESGPGGTCVSIDFPAAPVAGDGGASVLG